MRFFSYDPIDHEFSLHVTAAAARANAQKHLEHSRDCDGWPEEVTGICWGSLRECVEEVAGSHIAIDEDGVGEDGEQYPAAFDYVCDYALRPVGPEPPDDAAQGALDAARSALWCAGARSGGIADGVRELAAELSEAEAERDRLRALLIKAIRW